MVTGGIALLFLSTDEASERRDVVAGGVGHLLAVEANGGGIPATRECTAQAWSDEASSDGTIKMTRGLLQSVADEASGGSITVELGCLLRSLAGKASGSSIPKMTGCVLLLSTGKVRGKVW